MVTLLKAPSATDRFNTNRLKC